MAVYYGARWLAYDKQNNLIMYWYAYSFMGIASYYFELYTLVAILVVGLPVIATIFLLIHQRTLQKNFIALKRPFHQPTTLINKEWLSSLIRACVVMLNQGKSVFVLFEHTEHIAHFVHCPIPIEAPINYELLHVVTSSQAHDPENMLWVSTQGSLRGINTTWRHQLDDVWLCADVKELENWKQHALFITSKTDGLVFHLDPITHTSTLVMQGKAMERVPLEKAITMLAQYTGADASVLEKGEDYRAHYPAQKQSRSQHTP